VYYLHAEYIDLFEENFVLQYVFSLNGKYVSTSEIKASEL